MAWLAPTRDSFTVVSPLAQLNLQLPNLGQTETSHLPETLPLGGIAQIPLKRRSFRLSLKHP